MVCITIAAAHVGGWLGARWWYTRERVVMNNNYNQHSAFFLIRSVVGAVELAMRHSEAEVETLQSSTVHAASSGLIWPHLASSRLISPHLASSGLMFHLRTSMS
jgi:hypothetical protein